MTQEEYNQILDNMDHATQETGAFTLVQWADYLERLVNDIQTTSQEVYEKYRVLVDAFRVNFKIALEKDSARDMESAKRIAAAVEKACDLKIIDDKYRIQAEAFIDSDVFDDIMFQLRISDRVSGESNTGIVKLIYKSARSATIEISDGGKYYTKEHYAVRINGLPTKSTNTVITSLYNLTPETGYEVKVEDSDGNILGGVTFVTEYEYTTLNVKDFGAKGDGQQDDTRFIQAAIMSCPPKGRVLIPAGTYNISTIFLKSDLNIEIAKGAELKAYTDRSMYAYFPAVLQTTDETDEYHLGTWEGNPLPCFTGIICGVGCENVTIYGEGTINGNASKENWWNNPKIMNIAWRPRLFFITKCKHITLQGVTFKNSPSWTLHPVFSDDLKFYNLNVENPADSPNTDGLDPESCIGIEIAGVRFSLGDDCIAVKSSKIYMGRKYKRPTEKVLIHQCLMENGHGAVTLGSEIAAGVRDFTVKDCLFSHTDRGLRIKTRRGRGKDSIIDGITFEDLVMDNVMTPFVINSFYFCDPDGKTDYVQSREMHPVDDATPYIGCLTFKNIEAKECHVAAAHYDGLPEQKIEMVTMENVNITYSDNPKCDVPAMSLGVEACCKKGIFANNVRKLVLNNVNITGQDGDVLTAVNVDEIEQ